MELVRSNAQGELSPLEIGIHALNVVEKSSGGRGNRGGLSVYAKDIGRSKVTLTEWVKAAEVYKTVRTCEQLTDKPKHLYEISKAPRECWQTLVDHLIKWSWSVNDCKHWVSKVNEYPTNQTNHQPPEPPEQAQAAQRSK